MTSFENGQQPLSVNELPVYKDVCKYISLHIPAHITADRNKGILVKLYI